MITIASCTDRNIYVDQVAPKVLSNKCEAFTHRQGFLAGTAPRPQTLAVSDKLGSQTGSLELFRTWDSFCEERTTLAGSEARAYKSQAA